MWRVKGLRLLTPTEYLELFFRNLLLGEANVLQSRCLIVGGWKGPDDPTSNVSIPTSNPTSRNRSVRFSSIAILKNRTGNVVDDSTNILF